MSGTNLETSQDVHLSTVLGMLAAVFLVERDRVIACELGCRGLLVVFERLCI